MTRAINLLLLFIWLMLSLTGNVLAQPLTKSEYTQVYIQGTKVMQAIQLDHKDQLAELLPQDIDLGPILGFMDNKQIHEAKTYVMPDFVMQPDSTGFWMDIYGMKLLSEDPEQTRAHYYFALRLDLNFDQEKRKAEIRAVNTYYGADQLKSWWKVIYPYLTPARKYVEEHYAWIPPPPPPPDHRW